MTRENRIYAIVISVFFLLIISLLLMNNIFGFTEESQVSLSEKRNLAKKPVFDITNLDPYPGSYENYFNDNFPFRSWMIEQKTMFDIETFDISPMPDKVLIGKDGWLFYVPKEKELFEGKPIISEREIVKIADYLERRAEWHKQRGIKFYVMFPPAKATIYPEYLPSSYRKIKNATVTDCLIDEIKKRPSIDLIELMPAFLKAKKKELLYPITDNHWNMKGSLIAYREMMKRISKDFPAADCLREDDIRFNDTQMGIGNLGNMINLKGVGEKEIFPIIRNAGSKHIQPAGYSREGMQEEEFASLFEKKDPKLPHAVIIRDSFCSYLYPYLNESFSRVLYIFDGWLYGLNGPIIESEKPDLVILMIYEPHINNLLKDVSLLK